MQSLSALIIIWSSKGSNMCIFPVASVQDCEQQGKTEALFWMLFMMILGRIFWPTQVTCQRYSQVLLKEGQFWASSTRKGLFRSVKDRKSIKRFLPHLHRLKSVYLQQEAGGLCAECWALGVLVHRIAAPGSDLLGFRMCLAKAQEQVHSPEWAQNTLCLVLPSIDLCPALAKELL